MRRGRVVLYGLGLPMLMLAAWSLEGPKRIVLLVLGFSLIIFVHELGHFIAARWCSVKTEVFSIGIGPRMVGWRKGVGLSFGNEKPLPEAQEKTAGEVADEKIALQPLDEAGTARAGEIGQCDYRLSWLPLGGYVRMLGQDDMDPTKVSEDPHAFNNRPIWQRMIIVSAGVTMNILFAIVVFAILFRPNEGVEMAPAIVGQVLYNAPAYGHLRAGDEIIAINGEKPSEGFLEFTDIVIASALSNRGDKIHLTFLRNGEVMQTDVSPVTLPDTGLLGIGIGPIPTLNVRSLARGEADATDPAAAELKKVRAGDTIVAVNGTPVATYPELVATVQKAGHSKVTLTLANSNAGVSPHEQTIELQSELGFAGAMGDYPSAMAGLALRPRIDGTVAGSPADKAGLQKNDIVVRVGATANPSTPELQSTLERNMDQAVELEVLRGDKHLTIAVTPVLDRRSGKVRMGAALTLDYEHPIIAAPAGDSPPALAQVERGATLLAVDNQPVANWYEARRILLAATGKEVAVKVKGPSGRESTVMVAFDEDQHTRLADRFVYQCGLPLESMAKIQKSSTYVGAVTMGLSHTYKFVIQTYLTLRGLFTRTVPTDQLHGPLGIAKLTYDVQEKGGSQLLLLMAIVSVNLAVANFLPLPIVDGGLFILLVVEKLRGKPLPLKVLNAINIAGIGLLASVFLYVTLHNDLGLFMK